MSTGTASPRRRARYPRPVRLAVTAAVPAVLAALAAGPGSAAAPSPAGTTATPARATAPTAAGVAPFGAFLGSGALGVARTTEFSAWLGGAEPTVGHTYLPGGRWADIEGAPTVLDVWADWRAEKADRMLVLNVPMLERNEEHLSDTEVRSLLRRGAAGEFDTHFRRLAQRLVDADAPDTVVVLGWEMNGITYTHRCGPDPEAWKTYWNRIVAAMRAVPGQRFRFDFAPSRGRDAVPWTQCYPGDATVDVIGMDSYDQPAGASFDQQVAEPYGLQAQVDFAASHGKPVSYPEWGLFSNGDDAEYMRRMLAWMREHRPLYETITDYCPHGVWECADNPQASAVYRAGITAPVAGTGASGPGAPAPAPPATAAPSGPPPAPGCVRLDLGSWIEHRLGRKLCLRPDWWRRW